MGDLWWQTTDYLRHGGFIMLPLVAVSVVMWTLIIDRLREYAGMRRGDLDTIEAMAMMASGGPANSRPPAAMRASLVHHFLLERSGNTELDREILGQCTLRLRQRLDERLAVIGVLAAIAPLLGLLGTVLGMIETFDVIAVFGTGNSRAMASGIGVALITTQTGLLVAIPGMVMSNRLGRAAQQLRTGLDETRAALARNLGTGGQMGSLNQ
jgi:biopolymer transport protein ExbB